MGGKGRARTQRKHFRQSRQNVWKRSRSDSQPETANLNHADDANTTNPTWEPFATQNPAFDEYYKEQGIVSPDEWDLFIEVLRRPLPAAFRINSRLLMEVKWRELGQYLGTLRILPGSQIFLACS